jgi:hypothetical protein
MLPFFLSRPAAFDSTIRCTHRRLAIHLTNAAIFDAVAGSEHSSSIFTQLVLSLSRFKTADLSLRS